MKIVHLQHSKIDKILWDETLSRCHNKTIYALSWWLDVVSPNWEALVSDDFSYIMPLPIKYKWGIPVILQPTYTQQLGIFSEQSITESIISDFMRHLPNGYYHMNWNNSSFPSLKKKNNYVLSLADSYENIYLRFSKNIRRNIQFASKQNLEIKNISATSFFQAFTHNTIYYSPRFFPLLKKLIEICQLNQACSIIGCLCDNDLIAGAFIPHYLGINYYLAPFSSNEGKSRKAMFLLISEFIKEHANEQQTIDFEGSSREGVARLYKGFGAENRPYCVQESIFFRGHSIQIRLKPEKIQK